MVHSTKSNRLKIELVFRPGYGCDQRDSALVLAGRHSGKARLKSTHLFTCQMIIDEKEACGEILVVGNEDFFGWIGCCETGDGKKGEKRIFMQLVFNVVS